MRFQFDDFLVDDDTRQMLRNGADVHLSPKAFDLLVMLVRERPRVLAKADLHARLWPSTFVSDASLAMLIAEIRAALGESARLPRCVRTVHRHGYAFQTTALETPQARRSTDSSPRAVHDDVLGYWLVTSSGQFPLMAGDNIIGRDPKARIWLDAPSVSRQHACIRIEGDRATIQDLGSKNGTRARNASVTTVMPLADGDEVHFGSVGVSFRVWAADPTRTESDS